MSVKYPDVEVQLSGTDGNVFSLIGLTSSAMRRAGCANEDVVAFNLAVLDCDSYDAVLRLIMHTVTVS